MFLLKPTFPVAQNAQFRLHPTYVDKQRDFQLELRPLKVMDTASTFSLSSNSNRILLAWLETCLSAILIFQNCPNFSCRIPRRG